MFSDSIRATLQDQIVGQRRALNAAVRATTRIASGLSSRERSIAAYLFLGPTTIGKTHLVRKLAHVIHGHEGPLTIAECGWENETGGPWHGFATQLAGAFTIPEPGTRSTYRTPPLSILLIEGLEHGSGDFWRRIGRTLESSQIRLPDGRLGLLRDCLVFLTSNLCSPEILDETPQIGFSSASSDESEEADRLSEVCREIAAEKFGAPILSSLDGIVPFHRLELRHLEGILDRRIRRLNESLAPRQTRCEILPAAREFILERGQSDLRTGAHQLLLAQQKYVEFPLADLVISGKVVPGGRIVVDRDVDGEHLFFAVEAPATVESGPKLVSVEWR